MKAALIVAVALALSACASPGAQLASVPDRDSGVIVTATLAPLGSFEWTVAPDYTRLATTRRIAARLLAKGRITVETVEQVQQEADAARRLLDEAVKAGGGDVTQAREHIARAQALIGGVK